MRYIRYALYTYLIGLGIYIIKKGNSRIYLQIQYINSTCKI